MDKNDYLMIDCTVFSSERIQVPAQRVISIPSWVYVSPCDMCHWPLTDLGSKETMAVETSEGVKFFHKECFDKLVEEQNEQDKK